MEQTRTLVCKTWKTKTIAAILAVIAAVALPQAFHYLGMITDMGSKLGETFLPMHLAIFIVGYFAGAWAGLGAGLVSPVISFGLTTALGRPMPGVLILPFMIVELGVYGLTTGLFSQYLKRVKLPTIVTLLIAQVAGRAVRALALVIGVYAFGATVPGGIAIIWNSIYQGLPGLILQWVLIPLLVYYVEKRVQRD